MDIQEVLDLLNSKLHGSVDHSLFSEIFDAVASIECEAQSVPEGFVLVPKEPSAELVNRGHGVFLGHFNEGGQTGGRSLYFAYKAMIEAQEQTNEN